MSEERLTLLETLEVETISGEEVILAIVSSASVGICGMEALLRVLRRGCGIDVDVFDLRHVGVQAGASKQDQVEARRGTTPRKMEVLESEKRLMGGMGPSNRLRVTSKE